MKHFTSEALERAITGSDLRTEEELVVELIGRLDGRRGQYGRLAERTGISQSALSNLLTKGRGIGPDIASALGYRKVTRFEPIEP